MDIDHEWLCSVLRYDPPTGKLFWRKTLGSRAREGAEAGCVSRGKRYAHKCIRLKNKLIGQGRVVWFLIYGGWPKGHIDHINGDALDNRLENLRDVAPADNQRNMKLRKDNKSGLNGVLPSKNGKRWKAQISVRGRVRHLGTFETKEEAYKVRREAEAALGFHENHGRAA